MIFINHNNQEIEIKLTEEAIKEIRAHREFTEKWIVGLRSGKYTQVNDAMCDPDIEDSACCLAVAEMECLGAKREDFYHLPPPAIPRKAPMSFPHEMSKYGEHKDTAPWFENIVADHGTAEYSPADWNDSLGLSFSQIADLLESAFKDE